MFTGDFSSTALNTPGTGPCNPMVDKNKAVLEITVNFS